MFLYFGFHFVHVGTFVALKIFFVYFFAMFPYFGFYSVRVRTFVTFIIFFVHLPKSTLASRFLAIVLNNTRVILRLDASMLLSIMMMKVRFCIQFLLTLSTNVSNSFMMNLFMDYQ